MGNKYGYYINLDERGEFSADVRNLESESILAIRSTEEGLWTVNLGFMRHGKDIDGLQAYMREMDLIEKDATVLPMADFERYKQQMLHYPDEDPLETLEANLGSLIRNHGTMLMGKGVFTSEDVSEVRDLLANRAEESSQIVANFSENELDRVRTFMGNLNKAIFDKETVTIAGGDFNPREMTMLKIFLSDQLSMRNEDQQNNSPRG